MEVYVKLGDSKIIESEEVEKNIVFDYDAKKCVVGVEVFLFYTLNHRDWISESLVKCGTQLEKPRTTKSCLFNVKPNTLAKG